MTMAIFLNGMSAPRDPRPDDGDDRERRAHGLLGPRQADHRQALDRRRRRQDHAAADAARRHRSASPCRSSRAAGSATPAARSTSSSRSPAGAPTSRNDEMFAQLRDVGGVICAAGTGLAPGRRQALRAARHHRHGRGDPADRLVDHVEEDRRGHRRARARREVRLGRLPARTSSARASSPRRWSSSARTPASRRPRCSPT